MRILRTLFVVFAIFSSACTFGWSDAKATKGQNPSTKPASTSRNGTSEPGSERIRRRRAVVRSALARFLRPEELYLEGLPFERGFAYGRSGRSIGFVGVFAKAGRVGRRASGLAVGDGGRYRFVFADDYFPGEPGPFEAHESGCFVKYSRAARTTRGASTSVAAMFGNAINANDVSIRLMTASAVQTAPRTRAAT